MTSLLGLPRLRKSVTWSEEPFLGGLSLERRSNPGEQSSQAVRASISAHQPCSHYFVKAIIVIFSRRRFFVENTVTPWPHSILPVMAKFFNN
jgi:hypothetical protein